MIRVDLGLFEFGVAAQAGFLKAFSHVARGNRHGDNASLHAHWQADIDGEVARYAFCKNFGYPWVPTNESDRETGDVVVGDVRYELRATRRMDGNLLLHPEDPDDHWAVLIRGGPLTLWIVGMVLVGEGKQTRFWRDDWERPCFVVPADKLVPLLGRAA